MKSLFIFVLLSFFTMAAFSQNKEAKMSIPDSTKKIQTVEASCGSCQFGLEGSDCSLAVRIAGKSFYVDGTKIDDHGDAHAKDGFCNAIRKAEVQGEIVKNRFQATYFKLLKPEIKEEKKN